MASTVPSSARAAMPIPADMTRIDSLMMRGVNLERTLRKNPPEQSVADQFDAMVFIPDMGVRRCNMLDQFSARRHVQQLTAGADSQHRNPTFKEDLRQHQVGFRPPIIHRLGGGMGLFAIAGWRIIVAPDQYEPGRQIDITLQQRPVRQTGDRQRQTSRRINAVDITAVNHMLPRTGRISGDGRGKIHIQSDDQRRFSHHCNFFPLSRFE